MRSLLATTCLTPIALCIALPAAAQTVISGRRSTPVQTATANNGMPDDVVISDGGAVNFTFPAGPLVLVNSDNNVTNNGEIHNQDGHPSVGIQVDGRTSNIVNNNSIILEDTSLIEDTDGDGDADGPFANNGPRAGISSQQQTGSITNSAGGSINIRGNESAGIRADGLHGDVLTNGVIQVLGDTSYGLRLTNIDGSVHLGGSISVKGGESSAIFIDGAVSGTVTLDGDISATGYRYTDPSAASVDMSRLDSDDLLTSRSAVAIPGSVAGGVKVGGTITSYSNAPALTISDPKGSLTIGAIPGGNGFGLVVDGTVTGNGVYAGQAAQAISLGGLTGTVAIEKGVQINGSVTALSVDGFSLAVSLANTSAPLVEINGGVKARGGLAGAIVLNPGTTVDVIRNTGSVVAVGEANGSANAIADYSGSLKLIENSGLISATGSTQTGGNLAILLTAPGAVLNQVAAAGGGVPSIVGDISFGGANSAFNLAAGSVTGDVTFDNNGAHKFIVSGDAHIVGNTRFDADGDTLSLSGTSKMGGDVSFGEGANLLALSGGAALAGNSTFGSGEDVVAVTGSAVLTGNLDFGDGTNSLLLADSASMEGDASFGAGADKVGLQGNSTLTGNLNLGAGANLLTLTDNAVLNGSTSFGDGNDMVGLGGSAAINGNLDFGNGANWLVLVDTAKLTENTTFGFGKDSVSLADNAAIKGDIDFGGGVAELVMAGASTLTGDVRNAAGVSNLKMQGNSALKGQVHFGVSNDVAMLSGMATLTGTLDLGRGVDNVYLGDDAKVTGDVIFGTGVTDGGYLYVRDSAAVIGNLSMAGGDSSVLLSGQGALKGNAFFGVRNDLLLLSDTATVTGDASFGEGNNGLELDGNAAMAGNATFGQGNDSVYLTDAATINGGLAFGDGANRLTLAGGTARLIGSSTFGSGTDTVSLAGSTSIVGNLDLGRGDDKLSLIENGAVTGNVVFGEGANSLALKGTSKLKGASTFGAGADEIMLADSGLIEGNVDLGDGDDILSLSGSSVLIGDVAFGDGADRLTLAGAAQLSGKLSFGAGNDAMTLGGTSVYVGNADFAGGGTDTLTLNDTAAFLGTLTNAQNLAVTVNGGLLGAAGTGTTAIGSLAVGAGGTLSVTINAVANSATRYQVAGNASFAPGSKLAISVNGNIAGEATYTVISAGSITGAANLTASQLMLPFLLKSSIVTGSPANEIAIRVARKNAGELGLNRSAASAYDAIFAALSGDANVKGVMLGIQDADSFKAAIGSMLPDHVGGAFEAVTTGSRAMGRMLEDAAAPFADQGNWGYWINGVGFSRTKDIGETASYDVKGWGTAGGAEIKTDAGNFGLSIGYLHGTDRTNGTRNSVTSKQVEAAFYWRGTWGGLRPFARLSAAKVDFDGVRHFNGMNGTQLASRTASADWKGNLLSMMAGASYDANIGRLSLRPILSIDYYRLTEDGYAETGGGAAFDLAVAKRTSDEFAGNATLAAGFNFGDRDTGWLRAEIEGGRRQMLSGSLGATTARFAGGQAFTLLPEDRTSGWLGRFRVSGGAKALRLSAEFGREQQQGRAANAFRASAQLGF